MQDTTLEKAEINGRLRGCKIREVKMLAPHCGADMSVGSERGDYVAQDYVFEKLGRPSRGINLMFAYFPLEDTWPDRGPCDRGWYGNHNGYFSYMGGINGDTKGEPFQSIRDVRRHGQEALLSLSIDCALPDEELIQIAKDLRPFGRLEMRINHEANGFWMLASRKYSYEQIGSFFVRFHKIIKEYAPNVLTDICLNGVGKDPISYHWEDEKFGQAIKVADIVSIDEYNSLKYCWPNDTGEGDDDGVGKMSFEEWWEIITKFHDDVLKVTGGVEKPIYIREANTDAYVVGMDGQIEWIKQTYGHIASEKPAWLKGITFYQFRDRGGLGLEFEDPNDPNKIVENPSLATYRETVKDPYFNPRFMIYQDELDFSEPIELEWGSATDATGLYISKKLESNGGKCILALNKPMNLIIKANDQWFYNPPESNSVDISAAVKGHDNIDLYMFAPPATGENTPKDDGSGYQETYRVSLTKMPEIILS